MTAWKLSLYPASSGGGARYDFEAFYANTGFALTAEILKENGTINAYAKTLRKVGHYKFARSMQELGLFSENPIKINGMAIRPIDFVSELFDTNTSECQDDMVAAKIVLENGLLYSITLINYKNVVSGFSAMQIVTAKPVAAMANMLARGWIPPGCDLPERIFMKPHLYNELMAIIEAMGLNIKMGKKDKTASNIVNFFTKV